MSPTSFSSYHLNHSEREGCEKKTGKSLVFCQTPLGPPPPVWQKTTFRFFFSQPSLICCLKPLSFLYCFRQLSPFLGHIDNVTICQGTISSLTFSSESSEAGFFGIPDIHYGVESANVNKVEGKSILFI